MFDANKNESESDFELRKLIYSPEFCKELMERAVLKACCISIINEYPIFLN